MCGLSLWLPSLNMAFNLSRYFFVFGQYGITGGLFITCISISQSYRVIGIGRRYVADSCRG